MKEAFSDIVLHRTSPGPPGRSNIFVAAVYFCHTCISFENGVVVGDRGEGGV